MVSRYKGEDKDDDDDDEEEEQDDEAEDVIVFILIIVIMINVIIFVVFVIIIITITAYFLLFHARRQRCVKCWTVDNGDDLYTHNRPEQIHMTTPFYDSATVTEETSTYENTIDHSSV
ncbi:hypothetical protein LSAT2_009909 [Lamellibrachia satsuma]|nr:hypothetical protein LSAT2_009909 [Lamellibrachia satsuma]